MSYQVLARKWRPNNFSELVGQEHVVTAISNGLAHNRLHHAYLFTGTRGVGKTTIARILSKSLNCEVQVGANPCGQCPTCQDIEQGRYVDLLEIDAASRTKVEDTRELLDNVQYKPTRGRYKVYLIDEVHMLSKHSFNALLKTLEEPPEHVKFLLATTDPQKLPITILSRCLQFNLKALSREQIKQQIKHILNAEEITYQEEGINHLAQAAQGSMRDALSLTDQAIASGNGQVNTETVIAMLGLLDRGQLSKLLACVLTQDSEKTFEWVDSLAQQSPDYSQLMSELLGLLHQIALTQFVPDACKLETSTPKVIYHLASTTSPEHVQLCYQIVLQGKRDLPYAADGRSGLEMTLLRLLAFKPTVQKKTPEIVNQLATELGDEPSLASSELNQHDLQSDAAPISETPVVSTSSKLEHNMDSIEHAQLVEQQQDIIQQAASLVDEMPEPTTSSETTYEIPSTENEGERLPYNEPSDIAVLQEGLQEAGNLSDTASLIAMKQQIKELNKVELEKTNRAESSEARDFEKLPFPSKKDNKESLQVAEEQSLGPEEPIDFKATEEYSGTETDIPPFDIDEPIQMIPSEQLPETDLDNTVIATQENLDAPLSEGVSEQVVSNIDDIGTPQITEQFDPSIDFTIVDDVEVTIPIEAFNHQGDKIVGAKQVDHWSHVIERMDVRGLTKQLALHSNYSFNDQTVTLLIAENKSHLNTDIARAQIKLSLEHLLEKPIELIIAFGEPVNTPFAIQQKINKVRHQYAYHLLDQDENIAAFRQRFDAAVEPESTFAR